MSNHVEWARAKESAPALIPPSELISDYYKTDHNGFLHGIALDTGSSTMVIEGGKDELIVWAKRVLAWAETINVGFVANINTPGYLPTTDPQWFETEKEAWEWLADQRREDEDENADETFEGFTTTLNALECLSRGEWEQQFSWTDGTGTVHGLTPGYDGDHDLGKAYTVEHNVQ